jgi:hypothetical protein
MKILVALTTRAIGDHDRDNYEVVVAYFSKDWALRLIEKAKELKALYPTFCCIEVYDDLNAYNVSDFPEGTFMLDDWEDEVVVIEKEPSPDDDLWRGCPNSSRVVATESSIHWAFFPKHASCEFETAKISEEDLRKWA